MQTYLGNSFILSSASFLLQFRFADGLDYFLIILGIITALALGCCVPINLIIYGDVIQDFIQYTIDAAKASHNNGYGTPTDFTITIFLRNFCGYLAILSNVDYTHLYNILLVLKTMLCFVSLQNGDISSSY